MFGREEGDVLCAVLSPGPGFHENGLSYDRCNAPASTGPVITGYKGVQVPIPVPVPTPARTDSAAIPVSPPCIAPGTGGTLLPTQTCLELPDNAEYWPLLGGAGGCPWSSLNSREILEQANCPFWRGARRCFLAFFWLLMVAMVAAVVVIVVTDDVRCSPLSLSPDTSPARVHHPPGPGGPQVSTAALAEISVF